jgi:DNA-binding winged helix-turn-helix (wHTH) protein/tetratricopeptide (TPR) repeat protein
MNAENTGLYEFGEFRLDANDRTLTRSGTAIPLAPKALDTLEILVTRHGTVISKQELMTSLWPDAFVEESNLTQNIYTLRKALGNGTGSGHLIENVPRRGYRFNGEVRSVETSLAQSQSVSNAAPDPQLVPKARPFGSGALSFRRPAIAAGAALAVVATVTGIYFFVSLSRSAVLPVSAAQSHKPEAMQAYTRGTAILNRRGSDNRPEAAIDEFQKAVTIDPTFALAYAGLAEGFASAARREEFPASSELYNKAKAAIQRSVSLDPNLSEAYGISGLVKRSADWDWAGAESDLRRAIQLNSKNARARQWLGQLLSSLSRHDEALSEIKIAYELDPIADYVVGARFPILEAKRDYDTALQESEKFHLENKSNPQAARAYATFLYHKSEYAKVIEIGERILGTEQGRNSFAWYSLLHGAYQKSLQQDKAEENLRLLEGLTAKDSKARYSLAMNYAELGRVDEAVKLLEDCYATREERMTWINVEPRFENLRTDPRFVELLKKMRFV